MRCDEAQIALEMRRRGALDVSATERVAGHLGDCEACREYERAMMRVEETMSQMTMEAADQVNFSDLGARVARMGRRHVRVWWRALVLSPPLLAAIVLSAMPAEARPLGSALGIATLAVMLGCMTVAWRRFQRESAEAARSSDDLLAFWRGNLDQRIRRLRLWPMNIVGGIMLSLTPLLDRVHAFPIGSAAFLYSLVAIMLIQGLYYGFWLLPRLRRERLELQ
jgi:4-amino-4-deoxy-L-arabinose transferase-like glycosyltransferase